MSQFDKLLQQIKNLDRNMRFDELRKVLEHYGYSMSGPASGSSHKTFRKPGKYPIKISYYHSSARTHKTCLC